MYYRNDCLCFRLQGHVLRDSFLPKESAVCTNITKKQRRIKWLICPAVIVVGE